MQRSSAVRFSEDPRVGSCSQLNSNLLVCLFGLKVCLSATELAQQLRHFTLCLQDTFITPPRPAAAPKEAASSGVQVQAAYAEVGVTT